MQDFIDDSGLIGAFCFYNFTPPCPPWDDIRCYWTQQNKCAKIIQKKKIQNWAFSIKHSIIEHSSPCIVIYIFWLISNIFARKWSSVTNWIVPLWLYNRSLKSKTAACKFWFSHERPFLYRRGSLNLPCHRNKPGDYLSQLQSSWCSCWSATLHRRLP